MSADRSWTIAPTLLWFCALLVGALYALDGDVHALADRVTTRREQPPAAGPSFAAQPVVADKGDDVPAPVPPADTGDRAQVGALEDVCLDGTPTKCKRWAMDGFYRAVAAGKQGKLGRPVRVSWYGDSVIATDAIPARLRARVQTELGDGGPGFVYVVPPHRFCHHEGVARTSVGEWRTHAISTQPKPDGLYGFGGSTAETFSGSATLKLDGRATHVELYYLAQPRGGTVTILGDGKELAQVSTAADAKGAAHATATATGGAKKFELQTKGKVRVSGVAIENTTGAVVDNLGIVSVNARNFSARDLRDFTAELGHRSPDLIMMMIGANEAQWLSAGTLKVYRAQFEKALAPLREGRPDGACLVVSPLDQAEAKDGAYPSRPIMPRLVETQRKAAHAAGCAFFSTYDWMGGKGSAEKWFKKRLVGGDFQHLMKRGANKLADGMFETLMMGHQRYAAR